MEEGKLPSPQLSSPPSPTMAEGRLPSPQLPLPPSPTMEEGKLPSPSSPAMQEGKVSSPPPSTMEEDKLPSPLPSTMEEGKVLSPPPSTTEEGKLPSPPPSPVKEVTEEQQEMVPPDDAADPITVEPPMEMLSGSPPATPRPVDPPERRYPQLPARFFFYGKEYGLPEGWLVEEKPRTNPKYIGKVDQSFEHVESGKVFRSRKAAVRWIMAHPNEPGHQEFIASEEASKSSKRPRKSIEMKRTTPQGVDASLKQGEENKSEKKKRGRPRKLSLQRESSANNAEDVQVVIPSVNSDEGKVVQDRQSDDANDIANHMKLDGSPTSTNSSERTI